MGTTTVGTIELVAKIDTGQYKKGADEVDAANKKIEGSTTKADNKLVSFAKNGLKAVTVGVTGIATAIGTMTIAGGITRALNIEEAQAKLRGLGHDTESLDKIMKNALASVKGTAYGLGDAATTAAGAVAAGIKPGQQLEGVLKTVANSAALAGTGMSEMGAIFNKVATANKVQMDVINQLSDRGIPVVQFLAKELGKTAEETVKLASAGKINFATFEKAMRNGVGDAAAEMGKTTKGSWQNMLAALSRVGEQIVKGPIEDLRGGFQFMIGFIDANASKVVDAVKNIMGAAKFLVTGEFKDGMFASWVEKDSQFIGVLGNVRSGVIDVAKSVAQYLTPKLESLFGVVKNELAPSFVELYNGAIKPLLPVIGKTLVAAVGAVIDATKIAARIVKSLVDNYKTLLPILVGAAAAIALYKTAVIATNTVLKLQAAYIAVTGTRFMLLNGTLLTLRSATLAQAAAQAALNTVMKLNPVGLLMGAAAALVGVIASVVANTNNSKAAQDRLNLAMDNGKAATDRLKDSENQLKDARLAVEGSALAVERAQLNYNSALAQYGPKSLEAREAAYQLKRAQDDLAKANEDVKQKTDENTQAQKDFVKAKDEIVAATNAVASATGNAANQYQILANSAKEAAKAQQEIKKQSGASTPSQQLRSAGLPALNIPGSRASGGPVSANTPYFVGENPDGSLNRTSELFVPNSSGRIINSKDLQSDLGGGGVEYNIGEINISSEVDGERWLRRLTNNAEIESNGIVPRQQYMGA